MNYTTLKVICFLVIIPCLGYSAENNLCSIPEGQWSSLPNSQKAEHLNRFSSETDKQCFLIYTKRFLSTGRRVDNQEYLDQLTAFTSRAGISSSFIASLYGIKILRENKPLWNQIVKKWKDENHPYYLALSGEVERGRFALADTLYAILDGYKELNAQDILRWARVNAVMARYDKSTHLYCTVIGLQSRMSHIVLNQMRQFLREADDVGAVSSSLEQFKACALNQEKADTVLILNWLADVYSENQLFEKELDVVKMLESLNVPVGRRLTMSAREHFSQKRYRKAVPFALKAYKTLQPGDLHTEAATILYHSYQKLSVADSALLWLKRLDISQKNNKNAAIYLYQQTGHLDSALTLLETFEESIVKDTLLVRHYLFSDDMKRAIEMANSSSVNWVRNRRDASLWRARTYLFALKIDKAADEYESVRFSASWPYMDEVLGSRFILKRYNHLPDFLHFWAQIRYNLFLGKIDEAEKMLKKANFNMQQKQILLLLVAREYINKENYLKALKSMEMWKNQNPSPEYLYYRAYTLYNIGNSADAAELLQKILLEYPMDVHAQKARSLLSDIRISR
ncbi:hypothetical protein QA601_05885 [Chitinispirillales bacterium ANBcel5]|uniref:tetratricopeptide repeat protein n=1 Tax=Cellulosispirillum alkaliphilum TaxID=3039283 RepID=UPI002A4FB34B|nr:hypothetical protein [Chitinispirillales bacterium ANBcel5]